MRRAWTEARSPSCSRWLAPPEESRDTPRHAAETIQTSRPADPATRGADSRCLPLFSKARPGNAPTGRPLRPSPGRSMDAATARRQGLRESLGRQQREHPSIASEAPMHAMPPQTLPSLRSQQLRSHQHPAPHVARPPLCLVRLSKTPGESTPPPQTGRTPHQAPPSKHPINATAEKARASQADLRQALRRRQHPDPADGQQEDAQGCTGIGHPRTDAASYEATTCTNP